ncbi:MAG: acyclic terpene utilization AtuA family protein, partial [Caldimonas sp.]
AEQLLYEIGDPGAYLLPDVICDFRGVQIEPAGENRVHVSGARGLPPTDAYKVSATTQHGFRCTGTLVVIGIDAAKKAERTGAAILARTRTLLREAGLADYRATRIEAIGAESIYGPHSRARDAREVTMRVVVDHESKQALEIFAREIAPAGTSWSPGTTGASGGRPGVAPLIEPASFMLDKRAVDASFVLDGVRHPVATLRHGGAVPQAESADTPAPAFIDDGAASIEVPLIRLAWARSGDKGNLSNIGLVARRPSYLPLLWARVTPEIVKRHFAHLVDGAVERYHLPGIDAINFLLHDALDGGGTASRRIDPLGKGMAQMLLDLKVRVPAEMAATLNAGPRDVGLRNTGPRR